MRFKARHRRALSLSDFDGEFLVTGDIHVGDRLGIVVANFHTKLAIVRQVVKKVEKGTVVLVDVVGDYPRALSHL